MINVNQLYLQVKGKWKSVYPIYFDSTKTLAQGRRLSKSVCIENPKLQQLAAAISNLKIRNIIEPHKSYSRDYFCVGRIKVQLVDDKNIPLRQNIPNKKSLLHKIGQELLQIRKKK